jgi:pyruvate dehydrogenase E1 component alpha subunit
MHADSIPAAGATGGVGAGRPIATGAALGFKMKNEDRVAVSFTGEGGSNTGNFHESMNMAALWKLPVIFVVENNKYAVSTHVSQSCPVEDLSLRGVAYGIPGVRVDGFDVLAVYAAAVEAVARARRGEGPTLLVTECYRFDGHYSGEPEVYRSREEVAEYRKKDPIPRFASYLVQNGIISPNELEIIQDDVHEELVAAVEYVKSPMPDSSARWIISVPEGIETLRA